MTFVGIDVSKARLDVAALAPTGEIQREAFENTVQGHADLVAWLASFPSCRVALEATGTYHHCLTSVLQDKGVYVSVLNPAQVSYFVKSQHRRNKTDKADALWLAVYAKERQPDATLELNLSRQGLARDWYPVQRYYPPQEPFRSSRGRAHTRQGCCLAKTTCCCARRGEERPRGRARAGDEKHQ